MTIKKKVCILTIHENVLVKIQVPHLHKCAKVGHFAERVLLLMNRIGLFKIKWKRLIDEVF